MRYVLLSALFFWSLAQAQAEYIGLTLSNRYSQIEHYRMEYLDTSTWDWMEGKTDIAMVYVEQDQKLDQRQHFVTSLKQPAESYGIFVQGSVMRTARPIWGFAPGAADSRIDWKHPVFDYSCVVSDERDGTTIEDIFFQKKLFSLTPTNDPIKTDSGFLVYDLDDSKGNYKVAVNPTNQTVAWIHFTSGREDRQTDYSDYRETTAGLFPYQIKMTVLDHSQGEGHALIQFSTFEPNPATNTLLPFKIPMYTVVDDHRFNPSLRYIQGTNQYTDEELAKFAFDKAKGKTVFIGYMRKQADSDTNGSPVSWKVRGLIICVMIAGILVPLLIFRRGNQNLNK